ncbi:MAG: acyltransferase domain-containing protein, partial [Gammaproteobacteria bacterium]|nr:acyltransferase domain-containing protein [Gammaproteobacteria bacterium]
KNQPKRYWTSSSELITLTATNKTELLNECESLLQQTNAYAKKPEHLNRIARASQTTIDPQAKIRLAIVANNCDELMVKLNKTIDAIKSNTDLNQLDSQVYFSNSIETGAVAFVFPGQGSQYINMSRDLTLNFPIVREHWDQAENHFLTNDKSLSEVVFPAPSFTKTRNDFNAQLQKTTWTQPALAVCGYAYAKLLQQLDIKPDYCIGHSLGELTALAVADSFDFETLVAMASQRANCMQAAASNTDSGMLAIKYNANKLEKLIIDTKLDATIANYNAPQQVVVSAEKLVLEKLKIELDQRNIRYIALPVAAGFHSRAVASAQTEFLTWLKSQTISQPKIPVIANTTAKLYPQTKAAITKDLSQQLAKPVLFSKSIQTLYDKGVRTFIEVGPKAILSKLIGACLGEQPHLTIAMDNPKKDGNLQLWQLLGKLFSQGININFNKIWQDVEAPKPLPTTNKKRYIVNLSGCNIGKPYPIKQPKSVPTTVAPKLKPIESKPMSKQQPKPNQTATQPVVNLSGQSNLLQQITSAHIAYQQSMARTHEIFLQTMTQLSGSDAVDLTAPMAAPMSIPMPVQAAAVAPAPMVTAAIAPAPMPTITTPPQINPVETPVKTASPEPIQATVTPLKTVTTDSANNNNLKDVLLKVVSEKTGYPTDMLDLDMDLEADLGVDSIKRVEILAAMQEHDSSLPEVDADQMAELNTLNKVLQFLQADNPSTKK